MYKSGKVWSSGAAVALALGFAASAHASIFVTTYTGVVVSGSDQTGVFGTAGANLTGDSFTAVYTVNDAVNTWKDIEPPTLTDLFGGSENLAAHNGLPAPGEESPASATLTINGVTISLPGVYYGEVWTSKGATGGGEVFRMVKDHSVSGSVTSDDYMESRMFSFTNNVAPDYLYSTPLSYTAQPGDHNDGTFFDRVYDAVTGTYSVNVECTCDLSLRMRRVSLQDWRMIFRG